jgi:hypothetical protein
MPNIYRIHPAIGIARVGDSPDEYFVGPEAPGVPPSLNQPDAPHDPNAGYKDDQGRIKRQGARFRIYEYTLDDVGATTQVREITAADAQIEWEVHMVNLKAAAPEFPPPDPNSPLPPEMRNPAFKGAERSKLVIDAGSQKIGEAERDLKRLQGRFMDVDVRLGDLLTDSAGRLIVLGGFGKSQSPSDSLLVDFANNDGWCDDTSDGPVRATIRLNGSTEIVEAEAAWVIVAPPDFAPSIENMVTLYDVVYNIATELHPSMAAQEDARTISFTSDIYPILRRPTNLHWVSDQISIGHGRGRRGHFIEDSQMQLLSNNDKTLGSPAFERRNQVFRRLRRPLSMGGNLGDMPRLPGGDALVTLTEVQYRRMEKWARGEFEADWPGQPPEPPALDDIPIQDQPATLDRAALESCVGGGFFPGIEVSRLIREPSTYDQRQPLRISSQLTAGALTAGMAVPWQADFRDCDDVGFSDWWPGQRPVEVFRGQESATWVPSRWPERPDQPPPFPPPEPTDEDWDRYYRPMLDNWSRLGFVVKEEGTDRYVEDERSPTVDDGG